MKQIRFVSYLLATLFFVSCSYNGSDEIFNILGSSGDANIRADIERPNETRSIVSEEGNVNWSQLDAIGIFGTVSENAKFSYYSGLGDGSASFSGTIDGDESLQLAYYPYSTSAKLNGNIFTSELPQEYNYTGESFAPMIGFPKDSDNRTFEFKQTGGLIHFTIGALPDDADYFTITSTGENALPLAGTISISDVTLPNATYAITEDKSYSIKYNIKSITSVDGFVHFFVPLAVGHYSCLSVSLYGEGKSEPYFTRTTSNVDVARAGLVKMPIIDGYSGEAFELAENTIMIPALIAEKAQYGEEGELIVANISGTEPFKVGQILLSPACESLPDGFLGRVVSVSENGSTLSYQTETCYLDEAFTQLYMEFDEDLKPKEEQPATRSTYKPDGSLKKDFPFGDDDGLFSGNTTLEINVKGKIVVSKNDITDCKVTFTPKVSFESQLKIRRSFEKEKDIPLKGVEVGAISVGVVPVAFGKITPHIILNGSGSAQFKMGMKMNMYGDIVVNYDKVSGLRKPSFTPHLNGNNSLLDPSKFETSFLLDGSCGISIGLEAALRLFKQEKLKVWVEPIIGYHLDGHIKGGIRNISSAKVNTYAAVSAKCGVNLFKFKPEATTGQFNFLNKEIDLLPVFRKIAAKLQNKTRAVGDTFDAEISTLVSKEVLDKNTKIAFDLYHVYTENYVQKYEKVLTTDKIDYTGIDKDWNQLEEREYKFNVSGLTEGYEYAVCPHIESEIIDDLLKEDDDEQFLNDYLSESLKIGVPTDKDALETLASCMGKIDSWLNYTDLAWEGVTWGFTSDKLLVPYRITIHPNNDDLKFVGFTNLQYSQLYATIDGIANSIEYQGNKANDILITYLNHDVSEINVNGGRMTGKLIEGTDGINISRINCDHDGTFNMSSSGAHVKEYILKNYSNFNFSSIFSDYQNSEDKAPDSYIDYFEIDNCTGPLNVLVSTVGRLKLHVTKMSIKSSTAQSIMCCDGEDLQITNSNIAFASNPTCGFTHSSITNSDVSMSIFDTNEYIINSSKINGKYIESFSGTGLQLKIQNPDMETRNYW